MKAPDPKCSFCGGTGETDSGGEEPWGAPINVSCWCTDDDATVEEAHAQLESEGVDVDASVDRVLRKVAETCAENGWKIHPSLKERLQ